MSPNSLGWVYEERMKFDQQETLKIPVEEHQNKTASKLMSKGLKIPLHVKESWVGFIIPDVYLYI